MSIQHFEDALKRLLQVDWDMLPAKTKERVEWIYLDTFMVAAYGMQAATEVSQMIKEQSEGNIPLVGQALARQPLDFLVLTGTAIVSFELDEGNQFAKGHPAAHIFGPLYVAAYEENSLGKDVLRAFMIGYEISARLGNASKLDDNAHPHGTWGIVGGAVAAAILKGFTDDEIVEVAKLAATFPFVTSWQAAIQGRTARNLYVGLANQISYQMLGFMKAGFSSHLSVVDHVWGQLLPVSIDYTLFNLKEDEAYLMDQNYFKLYPTCRFTHSAIDAAMACLEELSTSVAAITKVEVTTYSLAARLTNKYPETVLASKFSIPYAVAVVLLKKSLYTHYQENLDNEVRTLIEKIEVTEDVELTGMLPTSRPSKIRITFEDDCVIERLALDGKGNFKEPLPKLALQHKYTELFEKISLPNVQKLMETIQQLEDVTFRDYIAQVDEVRECITLI
ncbi:MmgE/PrpD family protein [Lysinibacillus fusiformis]|uniref:MmgE/PrpD family protein n=1 Tax=Lysinibacillus fusiformis TaxID=28031 RepID=UPI001967DE6A|nr:MmgE/PrpD family protein [Lysinibacillus fusiformis]QSB09717.1 MmgE/PrpD family protein [Lysinibacillus fusiformis]